MYANQRELLMIYTVSMRRVTCFIFAVCMAVPGACMHSRTTDEGLQGLKLPPGYASGPPRQLQWIRDDVSLRAYSRHFAQGNLVYLEIVSLSGKRLRSLACRFNDREVVLSERSWGFRGFFAIDPDDRPGIKKLVLSFTREGAIREESFDVRIYPSHFPMYRRAISLGKYSFVGGRPNPEITAFIESCKKKKEKAVSRMSPDRISGALSHPRDGHQITSPFWAGRWYRQYTRRGGRFVSLRPKFNRHHGLDLRGNEGDPIYAIAGGTVALAEEMYYEGNMTIIDHGNGIFSYYMHQSSFEVKPGRRVRAGELIGRVGSNGISSGPHLHVALLVNGVYAEPLSILPLPIRE